MPRPLSGMETICSALIMTVRAAVYVSSPPVLMCRLTLNTICTALSVAVMINGESPRATTDSMIFAFGRISRSRKRNTELLRKKNPKAHTAPAACEIIVASAAPRTPMPNANMNSGSSAILSTAPTSTVIMDITLRPCAVI